MTGNVLSNQNVELQGLPPSPRATLSEHAAERKKKSSIILLSPLNTAYLRSSSALISTLLLLKDCECFTGLGKDYLAFWLRGRRETDRQV